MTLSLLERAKKIKELNAVRAALTGGTLGLLERAKNIKALNALRLALGGGAMPAADTDVSGSLKTADWYAFDENRTKAQRQKDNNAVFALLDKLENGEMLPENLTAADKAVLAKYSGNGGGLVGRDGKRGSAHEYYTPAPVAAAMWDALRSMGFSGGKVLDPCAGTGVFGAVSPESAVMDAVEMDETSAAVNRYVNAADGYSVQNSPFEAVAANTPDETYDAVVTNVPFGANTARAHKNLDPKYRSESLEGYFIQRSLDKLKPKGLAAFLVPASVVDGKGGKAAKLRLALSLKAEFLGAYRLPNKVFSAADTGADVVTDIIFFRKYSREIAEKIAELQEQNPAVLSDAGVLWDVFLSGKYFQSEGKKYIIGTPAQKKNRFGKMALEIVSDDSVANIAKAVKAFGGSRIDWDLLDGTETAPIVYQDGDVVYQDGQTLLWQDGRFVVQEAAPNAAQQQAESSLRALSSPYAAFEAGMTYEAAQAARQYFIAVASANKLPTWAGKVLESVGGLPESKREGQFQVVLTALAVLQVLEENTADETFDYLKGYPQLSAAMQKYARTAADKALYKSLRDAVEGMKFHYSAKNGYSAVWKGERVLERREFTAEQQIEAAQYRSGSLNIPMDEVRRIYPDFDPIADDNWVPSADGATVIRLDDFLVGNYANTIWHLDKAIEDAATPQIAAKLARVKELAAARVKPVNVEKMRFDIRSPHLSAEEVVAFLKTLNPTPKVRVKSEDGKRWADVENTGDSNIEKLQNRLGDHMKNGTLTLGGIKLTRADGGEMSKEEGMAEFRALLNKTNAQFNTWVHANPRIMQRLREQAANPENLYFEQTADERDLSVAGISEEWKLHGYQADFVRRQSRLFGGINGFGVGLGKTATALVTAQYAQNVGTKRKTLFVVPNSVLSNWYKEAVSGGGNKAGVYDADTASGCLFVGADIAADGTFSTNSKNYARDLNRILENQHSKVFMTQEAFFKIRMKAETVEAYRAHLQKADKSFAEVERKADDEKNQSRFNNIAALLADNKDKLSHAPFFEDMGFDSIVIDEAHHFKNSKETSEFGKQAKGLGNTDSASARGIDALAKAWFIRGGNPRADGILCLTATPITNSPLEIYSMMSLAAGEERVNQAMLGVQGADDFMKLVCQMENRDDYNIIGDYVPQDMFVGLKNVELLRNLIGDVAVIKNAADVGLTLKLPGSEETTVPVVLTGHSKHKLEEMQAAYRAAREQVRADRLGIPANIEPDDFAAMMKVSAETGEPIPLLAAPFNLISKMDALILDDELAERATFYKAVSGSEEAVQAAVDEFNALGLKEKRTKEPRHTWRENILHEKIHRNENGEVSGITYTIKVQARLREGGTVLLDSMDFDMQMRFEKLLEKHSAEVSVAVSPKMAALAVNVKNEQAHIRATDAQGNKLPHAKQLVFCDHLAVHNKIKRILSEKAGVPSEKITFVSGHFNSEPDEILDVQAAYNADGADNRYCIVIANKKAEVGINLQKGTQAVHHLSIPWTPDALTQRNGRGVRQGNATDYVNVYHYDAEGTFDMYRRNVVEKKGNWIDNLMDKNHEGLVEVSGGLTNQEYDELIRMSDDAGGMAKMQERLEAAQKAAHIKRAKDAQLTNLEIVKRERAFQERYADFEHYGRNALQGLIERMKAVSAARQRLQKSEDKGASENTLKRNRRLLEQAQAEMAVEHDRLRDAFSAVQQKVWKNGRYELETVTLEQYLEKGAGLSHVYVAEVEFAETSKLRGQWEDEMTVSRNMQAAAEKAMFQDAEDVDGAFDAEEIGKALTEDMFVLPDGTMLFAGMLADAGNDTVLVSEQTWRGLGVSACSTDGRSFNKLSLPEVAQRYPDAVFVKADDAAAVGALKKLAQREAALILIHDGNVPDSQSMLRHFPQMGEYMPEVKMRFKFPAQTAMKPPYFIRFLTDKLLNGLSARAPFEALAAQQREAGVVEESGQFYTQLVTENDKLFDENKKQVTLAGVLDNLKAFSVKAASLADLALLADSHLAAVGDYFITSDDEGLRRMTEEAAKPDKTKAEFEQDITDWLNGLIAPYCSGSFSMDMLRSNSTARLLAKAFEKAHSVPSEFVCLSGKTYDFAMNVADKGIRKVLEEQGAGYEVAFVGKDGSSRYANDRAIIKQANAGGLRNVWILTQQAWQFLEASYAGEIAEHGIAAHDVK